MNQAKPFPITKRQVWEAYKRVKANQGGAGVDAQSLAEFAEDLVVAEFPADHVPRVLCDVPVRVRTHPRCLASPAAA